MCGIAGLMTADGRVPSAAVADRLAAALVHRGPDGQGQRLVGDVALIHTRLSIIDLATGAQPLIAPDEVALIANAEIYNDPDLRRDLADAPFATGSDCESPLHLYRREGVKFAEALRGMYAIAIHDPAKRLLVLARDPFGIKPLYYAETSAGFCFASEPQALMAAGLVIPRLDTAARDELLALQFAAAVPFAGVNRVAPGETLVVRGGRIVERHIRAALPPAGFRDQSDEAALRDFSDVWRDSVQAHQRADVPYGMFLSSGVDSSAVLTMMAQLNSRPVLAFTAAFPGAGVPDERAEARAVAQACGAEHVEVEITAADFWRALPSIAATMDDPAADYAVVPTYLLGERARGRVKVILTGEGGDEIFAGYGRYRAAVRPWPFRKRPWRNHALARLGVLRQVPKGWRDGVARIEGQVSAAGYAGVQRAQAVDCAGWLPADLLIKLDRCLMAHSIEGRVPFLDPKVSAFAFPLPDRLKIAGGLGKVLVRRWLAAHCPAAAAFARKRGFTVPVAQWIAAEGDRLGPLMARQPGIAEICEPAAVESLFRHGGMRAGQALWLLLFYALWHRRHMLGRAPVGGVFETLAQ